MKRLGALVLLLVLVATALWLVVRRRPTATDPATVELVATTRSEPATLNRLLVRDRASLVASQLVHDALVRVNHATQRLEPALAEGWTELDEGRRVRVVLRSDARFSDGSPITADDVVFSLTAAYDEERLGSTVADGLRVQGQPITAHVVDARTVDLRYPVPFGPGLRPLHALPILPRARYAADVEAGTLAARWSVDAPPAGMVGAGPFVLARHAPGESLHFTRNPHYWRVPDDGTRLPRAAALRMDVVPSQDAEMLRLRSGQADIVTADLRADDLPDARAMAAQGRLQLFDLGPSLEADLLWFNLAPPSPAAGAPQPAGTAATDAPEDRRAWLRRRELREAISHAVDRTAFINVVYRGAAVQANGLITPGNLAWHAPDLAPRPYSRQMAGELLDRIGVRDRDGDGTREDIYDAPASFTVLVQQGHTIRQRAAVVLQQALAQVGLRMEIASLDAAGLLGRYGAGTYEAIYHALPGTDPDPSGLMEFFLSSGRFHLWHPGQATPATLWEAEIDALMTRQLSLTDQDERRRLLIRAQTLLDAELPVLVFAVPRVSVATSARLTGVTPGLLSPQVLWNVAEIGAR